MRCIDPVEYNGTGSSFYAQSCSLEKQRELAKANEEQIVDNCVSDEASEAEYSLEKQKKQAVPHPRSKKVCRNKNTRPVGSMHNLYERANSKAITRVVQFFYIYC